MKPRKSKDLKKVLQQKGFELHPNKKHHDFYFLKVEGKKHSIYTYISHGVKEYSSNLMSNLRKQLKFQDARAAEDFFDCPMSGEDYIKMLKDNGNL